MNDYVTYSKILDEFGEEKIKQRYQFLYKKMEDYIKTKQIDNKVCINVELLQQAVLDYFTDIYRLKKFHGIERVNITKIISYEAYWILRRKPIQICSSELEGLVFVNENFLTVFLAHEFLYSDEEVATEDGERFFLDFLKHVSYHLKYRNVDKQNLELMLLSFETGKQMYRETIKELPIEEI